MGVKSIAASKLSDIVKQIMARRGTNELDPDNEREIECACFVAAKNAVNAKVQHLTPTRDDVYFVGQQAFWEGIRAAEKKMNTYKFSPDVARNITERLVDDIEAYTSETASVAANEKYLKEREGVARVTLEEPTPSPPPAALSKARAAPKRRTQPVRSEGEMMPRVQPQAKASPKPRARSQQRYQQEAQ
jgi:hypothetical protein